MLKSSPVQHHRGTEVCHRSASRARQLCSASPQALTGFIGTWCSRAGDGNLFFLVFFHAVKLCCGVWASTGKKPGREHLCSAHTIWTRRGTFEHLCSSVFSSAPLKQVPPDVLRRLSLSESHFDLPSWGFGWERTVCCLFPLLFSSKKLHTFKAWCKHH